VHQSAESGFIIKGNRIKYVALMFFFAHDLNDTYIDIQSIALSTNSMDISPEV
jgi:hypothetical protein